MWRFLPILFIFSLHVFSQNEYIETSNLPIFIINTEDTLEILDDEKINAHLGIINNAEGLNSLNDAFSDYDGLIGIEKRGNGTLRFDKISYSFETRKSDGENNNVPLLGMPKENDWILYGPFLDKSLLRSCLVYHLGNEMGYYTSRTQFCELIINDDYLGLYILLEKIKVDKNRVDITKFENEDYAPEEGAYIIAMDAKWDLNVGWETSGFYVDDEERISHFEYIYPKSKNILTEQKEYIQTLVTEFETTFYNAQPPNIYEAYEPYIDVNSFIDLFIINEFSKNPDGYRLSTFFHKDAEDIDNKIYAGPFWDYNFGFGNYVENESHARDWEYDNHWWDTYNSIPFWWTKFMEDEYFVKTLHERWWMWRASILNETHIYEKLDEWIGLTADARERNYERWPVLDEALEFDWYVWDSYEEEIEFFKDWIKNRIQWMDDELGKLSKVFCERELLIYPNPTNSQINFSFIAPESEEIEIMICDLSGRQLHQYKFTTNIGRNQESIQDLNLETGMYILSIKGEHIFFSERLVVE